jgi:hypothetical protein
MKATNEILTVPIPLYGNLLNSLKMGLHGEVQEN